MKKRIWILISVLLVAVLTIAPVFASIDGGNAAVSDATGKPGETVTVIVSIDKFDKADTIGIKFSYDERLTLDEGSSKWLLTQPSVLNNINPKRNSAAWCIEGAAADLNGDLLKLSFVIPEPEAGQTDFDYEVSCTVQLTNGGSDVGTRTATGTITLVNPATDLTISTNALALDLSGTKTGTITANVTPANTTDSISWSSSAPDVVKVENGVVTALKEGTADITVTVGSLTKTCQVTVTCSHKLTEQEAKEPTCQEGGWNKYYTCDNCDDMFKADGTTETTAEAEQLPIVPCTGGTATCTELAKCKWCGEGYGELAPHSWGAAWPSDDANHWHKCDNCDATNETAPHDFQWVIDTPETALTEGEKHEECTVCKRTRNEGTVIPHTHQMTKHGAVAATCKTTGNVEYWTCASTLCEGVYYTDEACSGTIADVTTPVDSTNHVGETQLRDYNAPTCVAPGYTGDTYCLDCGAMTVEGKSIDPTGLHAGGTATCTKQAVCDTCHQGYGDLLPHSWGAAWLSDDANHWHKCDNCDATNETAPHDFQWVIDTPETALTEGVKHEECTVCKKTRNEGTVIPHTHQMTKHGAVAATCKATGNVEHWTCASTLCEGVYYTDEACSGTIADVTTPIDASNHTGGTEIRGYDAPTCVDPGYTGDTYCLGCGAMTNEGKVIDPTGNHAGGTATCTKQAVCDTCHQGYGDLLPHSWGAAWLYDDNNHWHKCDNCDATDATAAHSYKWVIDTPATGLTEGKMHEKCKTCDHTRSENTVIPHTHEMTKHTAVAATCKVPGNVEYWTCASELCEGIFYGDASCLTKLDSIVAPINPDNHKATEIRGAAAANCYKPGYTGDTYCTDCGNLLKSGEEIPATERHVAGSAWFTDGENHWHICTTEGCGAKVDTAAHSYSWVVDDPATEDKTGLKHEQCICGLKRNEGTVIEKLDHVHIGIKHFAAVKATCVKDGTVEYWTCASHKCAGKYYGDDKCQLELETIVEAINPANHTGKTELKDNEFATCSKAGYSGDTYCTDCGEMVKKGVVIPATGLHTAKDGYVIDENQHWQVCDRCEAIIGNAKENHTYTWVVDKYPTEEATGLKHQKCTVCSHEAAKDTVIEKLEHKPTLVPGTDATCTEVGVAEHYLCANCGRYYASVDGKVGEQIEKADIVIEAAGHTYSTEWSSNETDHWHDCSCGETADKQAHTTEIVGAKEATENEAGYTGDKVCSVCGYVVSKGEEIPALPPVTEPAATEPADTDSGKSDSPVAIILIVVAAVAVCAVVAVILIKKRKVKA